MPTGQRRVRSACVGIDSAEAVADRMFDESMAYIRDYLDREGPFDGLFGFSQGAASRPPSLPL
jgi:hypothetical protein